MSYLKDYLRVIPKSDSQKVRENLTDNAELFDVNELSDEAFNALVEHLVESSEIQTKLEPLSREIKADELNAFYKNVALDLSRLFPEQNHIEQASVNYERIYQGHLNEVKQAIESLKGLIDQLEAKHHGEDGLILHHYGFEPNDKHQHIEDKTADTSYLYTDRDHNERPQAEINRLFHTYYASLGKQEETDALLNQDGHITARLNVLYESPYTLKQTNSEYAPKNALDGDETTFWYNVSLKPTNELDGVSIGPREEG